MKILNTQGDCLKTFAGYNQVVISLAHLDENNCVFSSWNGDLNVWKVAGNRSECIQEKITDIGLGCLSKNTFVSGSSGGSVTFWNASKKDWFQKIFLIQTEPLKLAMSQDGKKIIVFMKDSFVIIDVQQMYPLLLKELKDEDYVDVVFGFNE